MLIFFADMTAFSVHISLTETYNALFIQINSAPMLQEKREIFLMLDLILKNVTITI